MSRNCLWFKFLRLEIWKFYCWAYKKGSVKNWKFFNVKQFKWYQFGPSEEIALQWKKSSITVNMILFRLRVSSSYKRFFESVSPYSITVSFSRRRHNKWRSVGDDVTEWNFPKSQPQQNSHFAWSQQLNGVQSRLGSGQNLRLCGNLPIGSESPNNSESRCLHSRDFVICLNNESFLWVNYYFEYEWFIFPGFCIFQIFSIKIELFIKNYSVFIFRTENREETECWRMMRVRRIQSDSSIYSSNI